MELDKESVLVQKVTPTSIEGVKIVTIRTYGGKQREYFIRTERVINQALGLKKGYN